MEVTDPRAAFASALEQLFDKYPAVADIDAAVHYGFVTDLTSPDKIEFHRRRAAVHWREAALNPLADESTLYHMFSMARYTGVPDDELVALYLLCGGESPVPPQIPRR